MHVFGFGHLNLNGWLFLKISALYHLDVSLSVVLSWPFQVAEALDSLILSWSETPVLGRVGTATEGLSATDIA